jgi:hypothetical protein
MWAVVGAVALLAQSAQAVEPIATGPAVQVAASPVIVPPRAPFEVTVSAPALINQPVELQVRSGARWVRAGQATVGGSGTATFRLTRSAAGRYVFRAVRTLAPDVAVTGDQAEVVVTTTGLGDPKAYKYLFTYRGAPARWDPCRVVTYRLNSSAASRPQEVADLDEALRRLTYETGVRFKKVGATARIPGSKGFRYDADVMIAWSATKDSSYLGGSTAGVGGFDTPVAGREGKPRIVHGFVVLDSTALGAMPTGYGAGRTVGQVLLHELGHLVGLDHTTSADQMMRPVMTDVRATLYGAGDLNGLRKIGIKAGCA